MKFKQYIEKYGYDDGYDMYSHDHKISKKLLKLITEYGKIDGIDRYIEFCQNNAVSLEKFIKKYGEEIGTQKYNQWKNSCRVSLDKFINLYGVEEGTRRYNQWKTNIQNNKPSLKRYIEKYGEEDGTRRYNDLRKSFDTASLQSFIDRFGEDEGRIKYQEYTDNMSKSVKKSLKPGIMKYINSEKFYIDKYGAVEGPIKYNEWKKTQDHGSLSFFIKKYGDQEGLKKFNETNMKKQRKNSSYFSKISQELFNILSYKIKDLLGDDISIRYAINGGELTLLNEDSNQRYFYDFCCQNIIIEYNGDYWHANPEQYSENDCLGKGVTAKDIWDYDKKKSEFAINNGYNIYVVWDSEYKKNKLNVISSCMEFIRKYIHL